MGIVRKLCVALIAVSMATGLVLAFVGSHTLRWSPPPLPPRSEALPVAARPAGSPPAGQSRPRGPGSGPLAPMARSVPLSLAIPRIGVRARSSRSA